MPNAETLQAPTSVNSGAVITRCLDLLLGLCWPVRFTGSTLDGLTTVTPSLRHLVLGDWLIHCYGQNGQPDRWQDLGLKKLMTIQLPIPSSSVQRAFDAMQAKVAELEVRHATICRTDDLLIPATLECVFSEAH